MNAPIPPLIPHQPFLTRGAEGLDRRGFSVDEIWKMIEAGLLSEAETFELIDGEIVPMAPESMPHLRLRNRLANRIVSQLGVEEYFIASNATLYLSEHSFIEPDIWITEEPLDDRGPKGGPQGHCVVLAVEIALSSLAYDLQTKPAIYARHGIQSLWVINAHTRVTSVFERPVDGAYAIKTDFGPETTLQHLSLGALSVRLADL